MKISKTHKKFAIYLYFYYDVPKQDALNHPEYYLGPNWEAVLNSWLYLDTLSKDQLSVVYGKSLLLSNEEWCIAYNKSFNAARATIKYNGKAKAPKYYELSKCTEARVTTLELIGLEKLLGQNYKPVFFPLFLNI
jgi:hypothetical protein